MFSDKRKKRTLSPVLFGAAMALVWGGQTVLAQPSGEPLIGIETNKLTASDAQPYDFFGQAVALTGDSIVVGASGSQVNSGSAYVFVRAAPHDIENIPPVATTWIEQAKLTASDAAPGDAFGQYIAIGGDSVVVGAPFNDDAGDASGSAYVFVRSGTIWTQQAKLTASDAAADDGFGFHVAISGDTVVVAAPRDDHSGGIDAGSAYIFQRSGTIWAQQAKLTASDAGPGDLFGGPTTSEPRGPAVAITGDTVVVGDGHESSSGDDPGSAYIFQRSGTIWNEEAKLTGSAGYTDFFGASVGISGEIVVVGVLAGGFAYVFRRDGVGNWNQKAKLNPRDNTAYFGWAVGISGGSVVVGSIWDTGSAYVFELLSPASGTGW